MSEPGPVNPEKVVTALEKLGFEKVAQSDSHIVLRHSDGRWTTVQVTHSEKHLDFHHPDGRWTSADVQKDRILSKGMLRKILDDAGIPYESFTDIT